MLQRAGDGAAPGSATRGLTRSREIVMADEDQMDVYSASFSSVADAEKALDILQQLYKTEAVGTLDAAVIDVKNGKPHVVKRLDRPRIRVIPERFGGGALPRKEIREAAEELTAGQAGLLLVSSEPAIEKALDKAMSGAVRVGKRKVHATIDQITGELKEALKPGPARRSASAMNPLALSCSTKARRNRTVCGPRLLVVPIACRISMNGSSISRQPG